MSSHCSIFDSGLLFWDQPVYYNAAYEAFDEGRYSWPQLLNPQLLVGVMKMTMYSDMAGAQQQRPELLAVCPSLQRL